jgi:hypothetical protein
MIKLAIRSLFALVLGYSLISCSQDNLQDASQTSVDQIRQQYEQLQLQKHPELKQVLALTGVKSIFDINPNDRFIINEGQVTLVSGNNSNTRFSGVFTTSSRFTGTVGSYVTGVSRISVACIIGSARVTVDATMYGPRNQFANRANFGNGILGANANQNISVLDSGRGYYQLYGYHTASCGAETSFSNTQDGYTK